MTILFAIDPGTTQSAWLRYEDGGPVEFGISPNPQILDWLRWTPVSPEERIIVIEQVESYGMPVGVEVFETVRWSGRFEEAAQPLPVVYLPRRAVKLHLCNSAKAKDSNIRQALLDRFGGPASIRKGGALYGIHADAWSALALAVTYADQQGERA